MVGMLSNRPN